MGSLSLLGAGAAGGAGGPPFSPSDIAGMVAWFDASDGASITSSAGAVSQWADKSGNARHLVQNTAGKKPLTGTRTINGLNVLDFDGVDDQLLTVGVTQTQPISVCMVALTDVPADVANRQALADPTGEGPTIYQKNARWYFYSATAEVDSAVALDAAAHCVQALFSGASSLIRVDGTQATGNPGTPGWNNQGIPVGADGGGANCWNGAIAELIVYAGDKTANFAQLRTYLQGKWGTP